MNHQTNIFIVGAGTFGTALAERLSWNPENRITLYTIEEHVYNELLNDHKNSTYFPGRQVHSGIIPACTFDDIGSAEVILLTVPSNAIEQVSAVIHPLINPESLVVNLAKGFSLEGNLLPEVLPFSRMVSLKGPTFAVEIMNGMPSAFTLGGSRRDFDLLSKRVFPHTAITLDHTEDIRGVELLSILKNAYAISVGIVSGRYNSPNVDFQVITKALNEMREFLSRYHCSSDTVFSYCGIGDLGLTSLNDLSRNRTLGLLIGKGFYNDMEHRLVIEGMKTVKVIGDDLLQRGEMDTFPLLKGLYTLMYDHNDVHTFCSEVLSLE